MGERETESESGARVAVWEARMGDQRGSGVSQRPRWAGGRPRGSG